MFSITSGLIFNICFSNARMSLKIVLKIKHIICNVDFFKTQ